jgi:hypothetical protein
MTAALATLAFLASGWIAFVALSRTVEESAARIRAALLGQPLETSPPDPAIAVRISRRYPAQRPLRAMPLRAAA